MSILDKLSEDICSCHRPTLGEAETGRGGETLDNSEGSEASGTGHLANDSVSKASMGYGAKTYILSM